MAFYLIRVDDSKYVSPDEQVDKVVEDERWAKSWSTQSGADKACIRLKVKRGFKKHKLEVIRW